MAKQQRNLRKKATRDVTVELFGWRGETRKLSVVEPYWAVQLHFRAPGAVTHVLTYRESTDYDAMRAVYDRVVEVVA